MAYAVNNTRGTLLVSLADNTIDTSTTDLALIGKNTSNYGEVQNENFVHLMENFASGTQPANPQEGQLWYDTTNRTMRVYRIVGNNAGWVSTTNSISTSEPSSLTRKEGDTWFDSTNDQLRVFDGTSWLLVGPDYTAAQTLSGQTVATIVDSNAASHTVVEWYIGNQLYAIVNKDATFTPQTPISGFSTVQPGINFSTSFSANLSGGSGGGVTAQNADMLDGLDSLQFLRSDASDEATGIITFSNTTDSTTVGTGAIVTAGGVGVAQNITVGGGANKFTNSAASTSTATGAVTIAGGLGVTGNIYAGAIQGTPVGSTARSTGAFTTLTANAQVTATAGTNSTSTGTGSMVITGGIGVSGNVYAGAIQGTPVGSTTRSTGAFTALTSNGATTFTAGSGAVNVATGTVVVTGGAGISENLYVGGWLNVGANLTATGNIVAANFIGNISGDAANAAAITVTDVPTSGTIHYPVFATAAGTGQSIYMDSATLTFQPNTNTLTTAIFSGSLYGTANIATNVAITSTSAGATYYPTFVDGLTSSRTVRGYTNLTFNPAGSGTLTTGVFSGTASQAQYADLAEKYEADAQYSEGTVVVFGGENEITVTSMFADTRVAGVISTTPAYLMNSESTGLPVALRGKVPVRVVGTVVKGDLLVSSEVVGCAQSVADDTSFGHAVFAKALETSEENGEKTIYAVII